MEHHPRDVWFGGIFESGVPIEGVSQNAQPQVIEMGADLMGDAAVKRAGNFCPGFCALDHAEISVGWFASLKIDSRAVSPVGVDF